MQRTLQNVKLYYKIYNSDLEPPDHETDFYCKCHSCEYKRRKMARYGTQNRWSKAVLYPGEKAYTDSTIGLNWSNPYRFKIVSPFGPGTISSGTAYVGGSLQGSRNSSPYQKPVPKYHTQAIQQMIKLNAELNLEAQRNIEAREPKGSIWADVDTSNLEKWQKAEEPGPSRASRLSRAMDILHIKSPEQRAAQEAQRLKDLIIAEELGRWPGDECRNIVRVYQEKTQMAQKIAHLRSHCPIQYLHLLRAGYFEPIPVAWADKASNPLKFTVDAAAGQSLTATFKYL